ncbi:MAG: hypothetical protein OEV60_10420 [Actinomycetota bacterium]|nr:hypothetical protein [Actinomycetota bacterium]MDH5225411.1 hypothetical protein [Actinomycetota bacterium]MDH5312663.1 hypothetical protein [Actinomycetota bacterium]
MNDPVPFCEECGRVGATLTGVHPADAGIVRWTLYRCGHVTTEIQLDSSASDAELDDRPDTTSTVSAGQ